MELHEINSQEKKSIVHSRMLFLGQDRIISFQAIFLKYFISIQNLHIEQGVPPEENQVCHVDEGWEQWLLK